MKKTKKMLEIEGKFGEDIETLLRRWYWKDEKSAMTIGRSIMLDDKTIFNWMNKLGIPTRKVGSEELRQMHKKAAEILNQCPKYKQNHKEAMISLFQNKEYRQKRLQICRNKEFRQKIAKASRLRQRDSSYRQKRSEFTKTLWQDDIYRESVLSSMLKTRKPTAFEVLIITLTPLNVRYAGDGSFWGVLPNGHSSNPDFVVEPIEKTRKVIFFHGLYFHRDELHNRGQDLINQWKQIGYDCLIIWEDELDDLDSVMEKISDFIGEDTWQLSLPI